MVDKDYATLQQTRPNKELQSFDLNTSYNRLSKSVITGIQSERSTIMIESKIAYMAGMYFCSLYLSGEYITSQSFHNLGDTVEFGLKEGADKTTFEKNVADFAHKCGYQVL